MFFCVSAQKIRETDSAADVLDSIQSVCNLYPLEVVNYYSPGYSGEPANTPISLVQRI